MQMNFEFNQILLNFDFLDIFVFYFNYYYLTNRFWNDKNKVFLELSIKSYMMR